MESKKRKIMYVVIAVLGVLIVAMAAAGIYCLRAQKIPALAPAAYAGSPEVTSQDNIDYEGTRVNQDFGDVTVSGGSVSDVTVTGGGDSSGESSGDYICSYSSERLITDSDVSDLKNSTTEQMPAGKSVVQMVVNELYARHGYEFQNSDIQAYFDAKSWYKDIGTYSSDMDKIYSEMNDTEKKNIDFLKSYGN